MFNKAVLIGRITADPQLKNTGSGISVTGFTVAVDRKFSKDGERKADFINITAWRQQAEFVCKYFRKGDPIGVEGSIQTRQYEDKSGGKRTATEIVTDSVFFVGGNSSGATEKSPLQGRTAMLQDDFTEVDSDRDLPF